ncbi:MAG: DMT family transporter [Ancalomicrobiaceae bacterium]|nr:DMT family transporter [Ancalomicrobiaceae bacterium]
MTHGTSRADLAVHSEVVVGLGIMVIAMLTAPGIDAFAKLLTRHMPAVEVALVRFAVQAALVASIALLTGRLGELRPQNLGGQMARGAALAATSILFFSALKVMPLADALAITFVEPLILTAMSALILNEPVTRRQWGACGIGFLGALVIVRPSFAIFGLDALYPLAAAITFAAYHLLTRRLAGQSTIIGAQFITGIAGIVVIGPVLTLTSSFNIAGQIAVPLIASDLPFIIGIGIISFFSHAMTLMAYERAPANVLAPFGYLEIVSATFLGYVLFGDFPAWPTWIGIALIIGSGIFIVMGEHAKVVPIKPAE